MDKFYLTAAIIKEGMVLPEWFYWRVSGMFTSLTDRA